MGRRFWIGIGLLVILLGIGLWIGMAMKSQYTPMQETLRQAAQEAIRGNPEQGAALATDAQKLWRAASSATACIAQHEPLERIERLFHRMHIYMETEQWGDFAACCVEVAGQIEAVGKSAQFSWTNLL